jgi:hypothetical protein
MGRLVKVIDINVKQSRSKEICLPLSACADTRKDMEAFVFFFKESEI